MPATTKLHAVGAVVVDSFVGAALYQLNGITDLKWEPGIRELSLMSGLDVDPTFLAVGQQQVNFRFSAREVGKALGMTLDGQEIKDNVTPAKQGIEFYWAQMKLAGKRETGTNHFRMRSRRGMLFPRRLTAGGGKGGAREATLQCEFAPYWDGTNDPVEFTNSVALPAGGVTVSEAFSVGPVNINGVELPSVQSLTIDFGFDLEFNFHGGNVWPDWVGIQKRTPKIEVVCQDIGYVTTATLAGLAQGATDSEVYLRKIDKNGKRVANATAQHIKFTMNGGRIAIDDAGGGPDESSNVTVQLIPDFDGTTQPLVLSTASAIVIP